MCAIPHFQCVCLLYFPACAGKAPCASMCKQNPHPMFCCLISRLFFRMVNPSLPVSKKKISSSWNELSNHPRVRPCFSATYPVHLDRNHWFTPSQSLARCASTPSIGARYSTSVSLFHSFPAIEMWVNRFLRGKKKVHLESR